MDVRGAVLVHDSDVLALGLVPDELGLVHLRLHFRLDLGLRQQVVPAHGAQHRRWFFAAVQACLVVLVLGE